MRPAHHAQDLTFTRHHVNSNKTMNHAWSLHVNGIVKFSTQVVFVKNAQPVGVQRGTESDAIKMT